MPTYTTQTITGTPTGYQYGEIRCWENGPRAAAAHHAQAEWGADAPERTVVVVHVEDEEDIVYIVDEADTGKIKALRAVHGSAKRVLDKLLSVIKDLEKMSDANAESLVRTLESIYLDTCVIAEFKDEHPTTKAHHVSLNAMDIFAGVRLFLHSNTGVEYLADEHIDEHGGFNPIRPRDEA